MASEKDNIWYASNLTQIVLKPRQSIEAFGQTRVKYKLVSERMDDPNRSVVREGIVYSERPLILTPEHFAEQMLENFGIKAREYANVLVKMGELSRMLKYGLCFRKDEVSSNEVSEPLAKLVPKLKEEMETADDSLTTLIIGDDQLWEVSLLRFMVDYVQQSLPSNVEELHGHPETGRLLNPMGALQDEIEMDFMNARRDQAKIHALASKLKKHQLFEQYEDRFYALVTGKLN